VQLARIRKHSRNAARLRGLLSRNPVLYSGLALPFAVSATYSLRNGVAICILMLLTTLPVLLVASLVRERIPQYCRIILYTFLAMAMLFPGSGAVAWIAPNIFDSLGIYFALMCINTLMYTRAEDYAIHNPPHKALFDGLCHALGFSLVVCVVSLVRELFGAGTVWGEPVDWLSLRIGGLLVPFSGFLLLGFLAAGIKAAHRLIRLYLLHADDPPHRPAAVEEEAPDEELEALLEEQDSAVKRRKKRRGRA